MSEVTIKPIKILSDKINELPEDIKMLIENNKAEMFACESEGTIPGIAMHHMSNAGYLEYLMGFALEERPIEEAFSIAGELEKHVSKMKANDDFICSL